MNAQVTTTIDATAIGEEMRKHALATAAATGKALDDIVVRAANAKHEFSLAPLALRAAIIANMSQDDIDALPMPGLRWKNETTGQLNNNPDICQWKDTANPDGKPKEISFYVVWADNTPHGAEVVRELDWCSRAASDKYKTDDIPADWMRNTGNNPESIKKRKKYLDGRRATVRKAYKDAVRLIWQVDMVDELEGCVCNVGEGDDNTITVVNQKSIKNGVAGEYKIFSVGAFLKLKPALASKAGGSYAALIATAEREPKQPEQNKIGLEHIKANDIKSLPVMDKVGVAFLTYLDKAMADKSGSEYGALLRHLTQAGGAQSVHTLGTIRKHLNTLFKMDQVNAIYEAEESAAA